MDNIQNESSCQDWWTRAAKNIDESFLGGKMLMPLCFMTNDAVAAVCKDEMDCSCGNGAITWT